jgi:hypothetical protein
MEFDALLESKRQKLHDSLLKLQNNIDSRIQMERGNSQKIREDADRFRTEINEILNDFDLLMKDISENE